MMRVVSMARGWRMVPATLLAAAVAACRPAPAPPPSPQALPRGTFVDLSHAYDAQTIMWPTADPFRLEVVSNGVNAQGFFYASNNFFTSEHGGTHLDAPRHFAEGHQTADQIPVDRFIGPAIVVDVTEASAQNADYLVEARDFQAWEMEHGRIPPGTIVLIRTGFSSRWPDAASYLGTAERGAAAIAKLHFPGLHPDGAQWLASRSVKAVGIDTASIDFGQSTLFETHRLLAAADIPIFENLTGLERVPARGAFVFALPMKIGNGSGAPLRAVALVP